MSSSLSDTDFTQANISLWVFPSILNSQDVYPEKLTFNSTSEFTDIAIGIWNEIVVGDTKGEIHLYDFGVWKTLVHEADNPFPINDVYINKDYLRSKLL